MIPAHITKYDSWTYIPPVRLLQFAVDRPDSLGEDFPDIMMFSPEATVPIKYRSN